MKTIADLSGKEVINISDCTRLGYECDVEFDIGTLITAIRVPGKSGILKLFGKCEDYVIPWCSIKKIGDDIILVDA